jgi:hypothetical protein
MDALVRPLRVLSLGAGVQFSTVALMMKHGEIEKADVMIFADTGAEPPSVYKYLGWLVAECAGHIPFLQVMHDDGLTKALEASARGLVSQAYLAGMQLRDVIQLITDADREISAAPSLQHPKEERPR